jgi:hypothetical protein
MSKKTLLRLVKQRGEGNIFILAHVCSEDVGHNFKELQGG